MKLVKAGEKGKSIKLSPQCEDKIFTDKTDDGQDITIVKGRVVRVDSPSSFMGDKLAAPIYAANDKTGKPYTLLIETDEDPTEVPQSFEQQLRAAELNQRKVLLANEAAALGFNLTPHSSANAQEGDVVDTSTDRIVAGQVESKTASKLTPPTGETESPDKTGRVAKAEPNRK